MESIKKKIIIKLSTIFFVIYVLIWIAPGIISSPLDMAIELFTKSKQVDSWSHGDTGWLYTVIGLPVVYLFLISYIVFKKQNEKNA